MTSKLAPFPPPSARSLPSPAPRDTHPESGPQVLDPDGLNTHVNRYRAASRRPPTRQLFEDDTPPSHDYDVTAQEIMTASAPGKYRDAVIAVDVLGLSYREAARSLRTREATITTRLHRGRQHVARELVGESPSAA